MTLFGVGNILLKIYRKELKRTYWAPWSAVILGVLATTLGIIGKARAPAGTEQHLLQRPPL